jgi:type I restriction enzyme, S subunit
VKAATLRDYPFVLPPLNEQRRIVAKIEQLFSDLDAGDAALVRAKANLRACAKTRPKYV